MDIHKLRVQLCKEFNSELADTLKTIYTHCENDDIKKGIMKAHQSLKTALFVAGDSSNVILDKINEHQNGRIKSALNFIEHNRDLKVSDIKKITETHKNDVIDFNEFVQRATDVKDFDVIKDVIKLDTRKRVEILAKLNNVLILADAYCSEGGMSMLIDKTNAVKDVIKTELNIDQDQFNQLSAMVLSGNVDAKTAAVMKKSQRVVEDFRIKFGRDPSSAADIKMLMKEMIPDEVQPHLQ